MKYSISYMGDGETTKYYFKGGMVWLSKPLAQSNTLTITKEPKKITVDIH